MSCKDWQEGKEWQESRDRQQLLRDLEEMVENHPNKHGELFYYIGVLHEKREMLKKQSLLLMVYRKYAARVKEAYKKFPALEIYTL